MNIYLFLTAPFHALISEYHPVTQELNLAIGANTNHGIIQFLLDEEQFI